MTNSHGLKSEISKKLLRTGCSKNGETVFLWDDDSSYLRYIVAKSGEKTEFTRSLKKAEGIFDIYLAI